jgi:hypothetical protein
MQNARKPITIAALALGAVAFAAPAAAQSVPQQEIYRLAEVDEAALPVVVEEDGDCIEEVLSGILTLMPDGTWSFVTQERETCDGEVEEDEDREEGTYRIEGDVVHFDEVDDDDEDDDEDDADLDLDDLVTGTRAANALTVRLEDGRTTLVFRR